MKKKIIQKLSMKKKIIIKLKNHKNYEKNKQTKPIEFFFIPPQLFRLCNLLLFSIISVVSFSIEIIISK
jgi:hypothetical protein